MKKFKKLICALLIATMVPVFGGCSSSSTSSSSSNKSASSSSSASENSDTITITVTNTNDRTVKNSIYYYNLSDSTIQIGYTSDSPTIPSTTGVSVAQNKTLTL